eukprot:652348-Pleurochrysis_carterae.AAC.1
MNGAEADLIHRERELITEGPVTFAEHMIDYGVEAGQHSWSFTWRVPKVRAERGQRERSAK